MHRASNPLNDISEPRLIALRFGPFELDVRSGELRRNGTTVRLQPQPLKVLLLLAGRPGEVVTREEIQAEIWPAGTFVDFEQSLNFCVRQIRAALRDDANAPRYVETLPRRGYRWVAGPVQSETSPAVVREWPRPIPTKRSRAVRRFVVGRRHRGPARPPGRRDRCRRWRSRSSSGCCSWRSCSGARSRQVAAAPTFQRITFRRGASTRRASLPTGRWCTRRPGKAGRASCRCPAPTGGTRARSTSRTPRWSASRARARWPSCVRASWRGRRSRAVRRRRC